MAQLALHAEENGDSTDFTYGIDPNMAATWDAHRIMGCLCDSGFTGYDCSQRICPKGDDPATYEDHVEVQLVQCLATSGYFRLGFRQQVTSLIPYNANASHIKTALEELATLTKLSVYFGLDSVPPPIRTQQLIRPDLPLPDGAPLWGKFINHTFQAYPKPVYSQEPPTQACKASGLQTIIIVFDTIHGNLPSLKYDKSLLADSVNGNGIDGTGTLKVFQDSQSVNGFKSIMGTTENVDCNNRGLCDHSSGKCTCFGAWSSSDGEGNPGTRGDCGYRKQP